MGQLTYFKYVHDQPVLRRRNKILVSYADAVKQQVQPIVGSSHIVYAWIIWVPVVQ